MTSTLQLLLPLKTAELNFKNRVFMAPMTRSRAPEHLATDLMAHYYRQRASAGLIFTEGTQISPQGIGYISTPGLHRTEQAQAWKKVTEAVHEKQGLIFAQLWHVGRVSHPEFHQGELPVAPSALAFEGMAFTSSGPQAVVTPRELRVDEIQKIVEAYKAAAQFAKAAGFDGVEIHGANGYLPAQFLEDGSNQRQDHYGGSLENRARFMLEIFEAVSEVWSKGRISLRLSPRNPYNGMHDSDPENTYLYLVNELEKRNLGILHFMEPPQLSEGIEPLLPRVREIFSGTLIVNAGYTRDTAEQVIQKQWADAVSFGSAFLANPDLPQRFERQAELNTPDQATFYGGDAKGYTDYPFLAGD
ncbi:alkene reductase [bacterium (Candidatus Blackallbacteria) CG17_big_fil_post_rev_8_21_14_2_50_48_46]|uniref:Alkene reductase n=1 Tax=bacterium (Candidatus Blackallbacteria) CG17_big_fil_post_rev_8_21_14_2_50_48_46 TaxID=2014261 RepID=A0A2M7G449_9BACT|nr:MAG: alkene reductase [bacterium (Candidatus Blackallbacteria) CG18_big_fil_WC_8_21_14_2_50_49_26]PIW16656.1 MAG: alkene reductase [bacterium (Candidatus Blackallbacteria) CG17_big_fil_post_rev_8_21_14_2_50_48_46]PIW46162.1 MAG: alkene reductase [bacterium (Candidatus Blackallbacteria) CG13_big_fil_rev_8_21_14_2_50_49_14]